MTLPSPVSAKLLSAPHAIAVMLLRPPGGAGQTVPLLNISNGVVWPVAIAATLLTLMGAMFPHTATVPSLFNAKLELLPAATATALVKLAGTFVWPDELLPQANTLPSASNAKAWYPLPWVDMATALVTVFGASM